MNAVTIRPHAVEVELEAGTYRVVAQGPGFRGAPGVQNPASQFGIGGHAGARAISELTLAAGVYACRVGEEHSQVDTILYDVDGETPLVRAQGALVSGPGLAINSVGDTCFNGGKGSGRGHGGGAPTDTAHGENGPAVANPPAGAVDGAGRRIPNQNGEDATADGAGSGAGWTTPTVAGRAGDGRLTITKLA